MTGEAPLNLGEILGAAGWRQGSILNSALLENIALQLPGIIKEQLVSGKSCAVLVSQDCDVVRQQDTEWNVELIFGTWSDAPNNTYAYGRHDRKLALSCTDGKSYLVLDIRDRVLIAKSELIDFPSNESLCAQEEYYPSPPYLPDPQRALNSGAITLLASWLGKRYSRPAFPDEFNTRITPQAGKKIKKLTKSKSSTHVSGVYLLLNEPERDLTPDENYKALFWFSCKRQIFETNGQELRDVQEFARKYVEALSECPGIEVLEGEDGWEVRGEHHISLDDLREFKLYNYDHRSRAKKPGGDLPAKEVSL